MEIILIMYIIIQVISDLFIEILYRFIIKYKDIDSYKNIEELERDINVKYAPVIVSMLYDNKIEPSKDIIASLLNLKLKGYVLIDKDKNNGKYKIKPNLQTDSNNNMCIEEKYIYDWIFENKEFNFVEWVNIIKKEYNNVVFEKTCETKKKNIILTTMMLIFSIFYLTEVAILAMHYADNIKVLLLGLVIVPIVMIITIFIVNKILKNKFLNNLDNKEIRKWTKFKRFMYQYTLIKDKNLESIIIYEKYIPYSMVLNINKNYKKLWKDIIPKKERFKIKLHYIFLENIFFKSLMKTIKLKNSSVGKYYD